MDDHTRDDGQPFFVKVCLNFKFVMGIGTLSEGMPRTFHWMVGETWTSKTTEDWRADTCCVFRTCQMGFISRSFWLWPSIDNRCGWKRAVCPFRFSRLLLLSHMYSYLRDLIVMSFSKRFDGASSFFHYQTHSSVVWFSSEFVRFLA